MASDLEKHLSNQLSEAQTKYTYFLLAVAASAIAFSVQRTTGATLGWWQIPLGFAVVCWAVSFFSGCRNRAYFGSTLHANTALVRIQSGAIPELHRHPDIASDISKEFRKIAEENSSMANFWGKMQFRLLVLGAILFLIWHVLEMANNSIQ